MNGRRMQGIALRLLFAIVVAACAADGTGSLINEAAGYSISGRVTQGSTPSSDAKVSLDGASNSAVVTNQAGEFTVGGVLAGLHHLTVTAEDASGAFAEKQFDIYVSSNTNTGEVKLPVPAKLFPVVSAGQSLVLTWSSSVEKDFREYRVYRGDTPGLDETTGTLRHVTNDPADTTFSDENLPASSQYFYRVFLMNDRGRLGGSNIQSATSTSIPILVNGGFENVGSDGWPLSWIPGAGPLVHGDSTIAYEGKSSLKFELVDRLAPWVKTAAPAALLAPGGIYRLSARARTDRITTGQFTIELSLDGSPGSVIANESQIGPDSWYLIQTQEFSMPSSNGGVRIRPSDWSSGPLGIWIDDVRLVRIR